MYMLNVVTSRCFVYLAEEKKLCMMYDCMCVMEGGVVYVFYQGMH